MSTRVKTLLTQVVRMTVSSYFLFEITHVAADYAVAHSLRLLDSLSRCKLCAKGGGLSPQRAQRGKEGGAISSVCLRCPLYAIFLSFQFNLALLSPSISVFALPPVTPLSLSEIFRPAPYCPTAS